MHNHGLPPSLQDFKMMLDFEHELYVSKFGSTPEYKTLMELIDFTRASNAYVTDVNGYVVNKVGNNEPRIGFIEGQKGLILESARTNFYYPSNEPVTKTIGFTSNGSTWGLSIKGSGSVALSGDIDGSVTATDGSPVFCKMADVTNPQVTFTVTGSVEFVQFESIGGYDGISTPIQTTTTAVSRNNEACKLKSVYVSSLNGFNDISIVAIVQPVKPLNSSVYDSHPIFSYKNGTQHLTAHMNRVQVMKSRIVGNASPDVPVSSKAMGASIHIMSSKNGTLLYSSDGRVSYPPVTTTRFNAVDIEVGDATAYVGASNKLGGVIKQFIVYSRALTYDEMRDLQQLLPTTP